MDGIHWQRVEALFHELAGRPPGPDRDALARDVQALLIEDDALRSADAAQAAAGDPRVGMRLGAYIISKRIARGGMATVYEAHRADAVFDQRVAIKVMDLRLSDPEMVERFRAERQILAALEHPTLTRLLDGGVTPLGEPFLTMEFVDGVPLDRYCDGHRLDVAARLRLFAEVCDGVAYAHRSLVLHRDLKPSNILVTADGRAKVVDFGTATLLQPDRLVTTSVAPLTPAYASPEQLTGRAVGTASDQYSLGVVLYELLTGVLPFGSQPSLMAAMERAIAGTTTVSPHAVVTDAAASTRRTTLARLRRQLSADLGTIVSKALAPDASARYASVQHLADDLARWSAGEPIQGRRPSVMYRATRFVQRHWVATSVAATLALALVTATAVSLQQAQAVREESGKVRELNRFLTSMLSSANPSWYGANLETPDTITVKQVLDGAAEVVDRQSESTPAIEAEIRRMLGRTYLGLGATDLAVAQLERARELYVALGDTDESRFTEMLLGTSHLQSGSLAEAESLLRGVVESFRPRWDQIDPDRRFIALNDLGVAISGQQPGNAEARALVEEAIAVADVHGVHQGGAAIARANLAIGLYNVGRIDDAEVMATEAVRRMEALPVAPPEIASVYGFLATIARVRERYDEAVRYATLSVEHANERLHARHYLQARQRLGLGRALTSAGELERARDTLLDAQELYRQTRPPDHSDVEGVLTALGTVHRELGDLAASRRLLEEGRALIKRYPAMVLRTADNALELGLTLEALGEHRQAAALMTEGYELYVASMGENHPSTIHARKNAGRLVTP